MTENRKPVLRFAPSPTGMLHIGGRADGVVQLALRPPHRRQIPAAHRGHRPRTLDARGSGRDPERHDMAGAQLGRRDRLSVRPRSAAIAKSPSSFCCEGKAYRCYRHLPRAGRDANRPARAQGKPVRYDGRWRDRDPKEAPPGAPFAVRLKARQTGETVVHDAVQGDVRFANDQLDDMVLLRRDGTPTYMLAVVVDDYDMGDHPHHPRRRSPQQRRAPAADHPGDGLARAASMRHLPLIHGPDGAKLSKRHGALAVEAYRDMGYLPETMRNYLLRLGWSHGNDEIIPPRRPSNGSTSRASARVRRGSISRSSTISMRHYIRATRRWRAGGRSDGVHGPRSSPIARSTPRRAARLVAAMPEPEGARQDLAGTGRRPPSSCSPTALAPWTKPRPKGADAGGARD